MTAAKLKELEAKATPGKWSAAQGHVTALETEDRCHMDINCHSGNRDDAKHNARLIAYLRNHCSDFIRLIEAASAVKRYPLLRSHIGSQLDDALEEALAAFKEKS
jgi:hypothetical protein